MLRVMGHMFCKELFSVYTIGSCIIRVANWSCILCSWSFGYFMNLRSPKTRRLSTWCVYFFIRCIAFIIKYKKAAYAHTNSDSFPCAFYKLRLEIILLLCMLIFYLSRACIGIWIDILCTCVGVYVLVCKLILCTNRLRVSAQRTHKLSNTNSFLFFFYTFFLCARCVPNSSATKSFA